MPEEIKPFEVAIVFNGNHSVPPRIMTFKGATGHEAMRKAREHLQNKTTFHPRDDHMWVGPDGEAVITPFIIKC